MKIGMIGSPAHVLSNKNVVDKKGCMKDITKEGLKDCAVLYGSAAAAGVAATVATTFSSKAAGLASKLSASAKSAAKTVFSEKTINFLKDTAGYKGISKLSLPGKAGVAAAALALAVISPLYLQHSAQKSAQIEKSYEV